MKLGSSNIKFATPNPRELSLVDLVFKTFINWGKREIPPNAAATNPIIVI